MLAAPAMSDRSITGTTIIFSSLMNRSPKNFELSTKGFTESGKNPSTTPTKAPSTSPTRIRARRLVLKYQPNIPRFTDFISVIPFPIFLRFFTARVKRLTAKQRHRSRFREGKPSLYALLPVHKPRRRNAIKPDKAENGQECVLGRHVRVSRVHPFIEGVSPASFSAASRSGYGRDAEGYWVIRVRTAGRFQRHIGYSHRLLSGKSIWTIGE